MTVKVTLLMECERHGAFSVVVDGVLQDGAVTVDFGTLCRRCTEGMCPSC